MATLTSSYQYLGRSSAMEAKEGGYYYYILLYSKAVPNNTTGIYTVYLKEIIASSKNSGASFYDYSTTYSGSIAGNIVFSGTGEPSEAWNGNLTVGDTVYSKHYVIAEGSTTVDCSDGNSKNINLSCSWTFNATATDYTPTKGTSRTVSVSATLAAIPRAATADSITCSTSYLDGTITYKYTPKSTSYYIRGNLSLNVDGEYIRIRSTYHGKPSSTSQQTQNITLTEAELSTIYENLPDTASAKVRITVRTYSNSDYSTQVGGAEYKEISLTIPTSVKPTVSLAVEMINDNSWIKGKNIYVAGYSKAKLTLTASPGDGAKLSSLSIGSDFSGPIKIASGSSTSAAVSFASSGSYTFTGTATDSRKRTKSSSKTLTVLSYSKPTITALSVERGTYSSSWAADETGPDVRVTFKATLKLGDNGNVYSAAFKIDNTAETPDAGSVSNLKSGTSYSVYFKSIDGEASRRLNLTVTDSIGETDPMTITIPTINVTIEFNDSGKGLALGKTSEKDAFECAWDAEFSGDLKKIRSDGTEVVIDDTGWIELGLSENVTERDGAFGHAGKGCFYRVINGNHVYVAFACDVAYANSQVVINANMIPQAYRPTRHIYGLSSTGGRAVARVIVNYSGQILVDYIQQLSAASNTTALTTWVDGYIDYWI